jgi:hypothetical protein
MREIFVLLTGCASLDILIDPGSLQGPEVIVLDLSYCFVAAWMSHTPVVVILSEDPPCYVLTLPLLFLTPLYPFTHFHMRLLIPETALP